LCFASNPACFQSADFSAPDLGVHLERGLQITERKLARANDSQGGRMLGWALTFLIVAIIAAIFGFGGIATAAAGIARFLFFVFLVIFVVTLIMGFTRRGV
jgi:uncharacterized membrane protein YtjA (UPF0391 family)